MREGRAADLQRVRHVGERHLRRLAQVIGQARGHRVERVARARREQQDLPGA